VYFEEALASNILKLFDGIFWQWLKKIGTSWPHLHTLNIIIFNFGILGQKNLATFNGSSPIFVERNCTTERC
jgi:hypothetical protein